MNEPYEFAGIPITPKITASLTLKLFNGEQVASRRIAEKALSFHLEHGGMPGNADNIHDVVKKAMRHMKKNGVATRISKGIWQIGVSNSDNLDDEPETDDESEADAEDTLVDEVTSPGLWPSRTFGTGTQAIYIYYFPEYKKQAAAHGEKSWRCKVGKSVVDALERIRAQATTSMPEFPEVTIILTDRASELERALHSVLIIRGKKAHAPGIEWFITSPEEILELVHVIDPSIPRGEQF